MIDLLNLAAVNDPNTPMGRDIASAIDRVRTSGRYILGPEVEAFEREWADYCGVEYCVGTGNALDALRIILMAAGIGPGDEVIVPANTYIATWLAVSLVGAIPVPVDADPLTMNINPELIQFRITERTRAILAVHLYGRPADMDAINAIGDAYGLPVFADAAQAHGARIPSPRNPQWWRMAGSLCHAEAFSFYPSKNLGALGDGGCITTNDGELADKARRLRNYGGVGRLDHTVRGINSRLDEMQAAILRAKLPYLDAMNLGRKSRADRYYEILEGATVTLPDAQWDSAWHQFVIRSKDRDGLRQRLYERGVDAHVHYPIPPYLEPAYADAGIERGTFPVTEALADTVLSLPIGWPFDAQRVAKIVAECVEERVAVAA